MTKHNIEPVYNQDSRILILGSFPSVKSREAKFFYHHPQNRFWKVLAALFVEKIITNGKAANRYYHQYFDYNLPVIQLPSTSPANAMYSLEKLIEKWKVILWKEI